MPYLFLSVSQKCNSNLSALVFFFCKLFMGCRQILHGDQYILIAHTSSGKRPEPESNQKFGVYSPLGFKHLEMFRNMSQVKL